MKKGKDKVDPLCKTYEFPNKDSKKKRCRNKDETYFDL